MRKAFLNAQNVVVVTYSCLNPQATRIHNFGLNIQAYIMLVTFLSFLEITHVQSQSDQLLT
jgi:hypothetical protein